MATHFESLSRKSQHSGEAGQATLFFVLVLGIFLLGALCLAFDLSNMWFHRQAAQTAADAACTAGAMDLLIDAQGGPTGHQGFTLGTNFDCTSSGHPSSSICQYALKNGYDSANTTPGNLVNVSFPASVIGVTAPPAAIAGTPFIRVDVVEHVQTFLVGLFSGGTTQDVRAFATCGLQLAKAPIPIVILNPNVSGALSGNGTPTIRVLGGASQSIQVNSSSATAVSWGGTIDLSKGGLNFTGSDLGTFGGPASPTGTFLPGTTGSWRDPSSPISDPFAQISAPDVPPAPVTPTDLATDPNCTSTNIQNGNCTVAYQNAVHGCPDPAGCVLYVEGYYPSGITVKNQTAIFDPGLYYLDGGLGLQANSMVRPGTGTGDGSQGTIFYLTGSTQKCSGQTGLVCVGSNSGRGGLDAFTTSTVKCAGGPAPDPKLNLPATLSGNVLLAPCTGTYGDPLGQYRGILFFADRSSASGGGWGGGGGFLLAGSMYFHQCNATGTGTGCGAPPTYYQSNFDLQGSSGSASYVLGEIIADTMSGGGTPDVNMALNPNAAYSILKASLLQ
jgi:hypothetical protein